MTDEKLIEVWGQDLYSYAYQKSIELVGYPDYLVMTIAAVGRLENQINLGLVSVVTK